MKVGIIRCMQTEDMCSGTTDFKAIKDKTFAFADVKEDIDIIGFVSCGGCPGKKIISRAFQMVKNGADTIVLASCITRGNPIGFPCPFVEQIKIALNKKFRDTIKIIDYTH